MVERLVIMTPGDVIGEDLPPPFARGGRGRSDGSGSRACARRATPSSARTSWASCAPTSGTSRARRRPSAWARQPLAEAEGVRHRGAPKGRGPHHLRCLRPAGPPPSGGRGIVASPTRSPRSPVWRCSSGGGGRRRGGRRRDLGRRVPAHDGARGRQLLALLGRAGCAPQRAPGRGGGRGARPPSCTAVSGSRSRPAGRWRRSPCPALPMVSRGPPLQPGAPRLLDPVGRPPAGRDPACRGRHPRLAVPGRVTASATDSGRPRPGAHPFRATYLVGGAAPAPGRRLAQPRRRARSSGSPGRAAARSTKGSWRPRSGARARRSEARSARTSPATARWAEPATVPYRGASPPRSPEPGPGRAGGPGDPRGHRRPGLRGRAGRLHPPRGRGHEARLRRPGPLARRSGARRRAARASPRSGLPPGPRPADRDGPRGAGARGLRGRGRRHDRVRHGRRGGELCVADPEPLPRVGLGCPGGRDGCRAPEPGRRLHAGRRAERALAPASGPSTRSRPSCTSPTASRPSSPGRWAAKASPRPWSR